jgi:hypothetical protein
MEKPNHVLNPITGRYISVNSKNYNRLITHGILKDKNIKASNIVYQGESKEDAVKTRKNLKSNNPTKTLKVENNKIVQINKRLSGQEYRDKIVSASARIIKKVKDDEELMKLPLQQLENVLKQKIYNEMVLNFKPIEVTEKSTYKPIIKKGVMIDKRAIQKKKKYVLETPQTTEPDTSDVDIDNLSDDEE